MIILEDRPDSASGGTELSVLDLARRSPQRAKLFYRNSGDLLPYYQAAGCETHRLDIHNYGLAESFKYLMRGRSIGNGVIYVNHYQYLVFAVMQKLIYGGRVFFHVRLPPFEKMGPHLRFALNIVEHFIAVSDFTKQQWQQRLGGNRFTTIHNGVSLADFPHTSYRYEQPTIFFAGRNVAYKGLSTLIQSLDYLPHNYRLFVLGDHSQSSSERVRFLGHIDRKRLPSILSRCHLAVVPSEWPEPCSRVLIEAMACNVPTIGSAVGGTPEVVMDKTHLFPSHAPWQLAMKIKEKINSPLHYREYVRDNFNIDHQSRKIFDVIYRN
jgi:glycosyltransferase involved in cell wall biosynthesis